MKDRVSHFLQKTGIFAVLALIFLACSFISKDFLKYNNLINVTRQLCVGILIAYGEMLLIISGFLDLSVGSVLALSGVVSIMVFKSSGNILATLVTALLIGIICNIVNAFFVARLKVPAFIATLGMMQVARGIALYITGGKNILQLGNYVKVGQGMLGPVPVPVIIVVFVTALVWWLLNHTRYGRSLYAIGGNRAAAEASGINSKRSIYLSYIINGAMVGLAGVIFMARNNAGLPNGAVGYEMTGLTAAIVGGTSFTGGIGSVSGTVAGAFIIGFLENVMNLIGVNAYIQQIIEGLIIALAVAVDITVKLRKSGRVIIVKEKEKSN